MAACAEVRVVKWSRAQETPTGETRGPSEAAPLTTPKEPSGPGSDQRVTIDLAAELWEDRKGRLTMTALVMVPCMLTVFSGEWAGLLVAAVAVLIAAGSLYVKRLALLKLVHRGSVLSIDRSGLHWQTRTGSVAHFAWSGVAGVGVSSYRTRRHGRIHSRVLIEEQLEIFEKVPYARDPEVAALERTEDPPGPGLPAARYRVMLGLRRTSAMVGEAIRAHRPDLWLGEYERRRRDTPYGYR